MTELIIGKGVSKKHIEKVKAELLLEGELIQAIVSGRVKEKSTKSKGRFSIFDTESNKRGYSFE